MSSVTLKHLYKSYGDHQVLKDINLEIEDGEFLVLVGPSGCGKSTTLRHVAGLEDATSGDIFIGDRRVNNVDPADRDIAMVFQNYALYPHMDVFENMAFGLKIRKMDKETIRQRVQEAAEILQIDKLLERKPKELSGGQRQRVALGRALVRQPVVFLFDEPLSNLDAKLRMEMRVEIKRLHQILKTTMIYVTHDQTEAMTMGDRIAIMKDGIVEQLDSPKNAYYNPVNTFVAGFIGMPQMNFLEGSLTHHGGKMQFQWGELELDLSDSVFSESENLKHDLPVTLGIRPEDIHEITDTAEFQGTSVKAQVEITEPLGAHLLAHLTIGDKKLTASFHGNSQASAGDTVDLSFDMNQIHLFDTGDGQNYRSRNN